MQIEISTRHGELEPAQHAHIRLKAEKLTKYFNRLMAIQVAVESIKHSWQVEILISAEHKHDFVAVQQAATVEEATDLCARKIEQQLRRYKEKIQHHKGDPSASSILAAQSGLDDADEDGGEDS